MMEVPHDIIVPPLEFRTLIGKTAKYVNKNGVVFENKIKAKESSNPKFIFLNPEDPYHAYYQYILNVLRETGELPEIKQNKSLNEDILDNKVILEEKEALVAPAQYKFIQVENDLLVYREDHISPVDLNIIKLVAQFAVINGDKVLKYFEEQVMNHSTLSSQFQFLKPNHSMHGTYEKYRSVYSLLWSRKEEILESYGKKLNLETFLNTCYNNAEYIEKQSDDISKLEEKKILSKLLVESIDWKDFEIVETIEFTELDEVAELGRPFQKSDLEYRSLLEREKSLFDEMVELDHNSDVEEEVFAENVEGENDEEGVPVYVDEDKSDSDQENTKERDLKSGKSIVTVPKGMKIRAAGESRSLKRKHEANTADELIDPVTKEKLLRCPITNKYILENKFSNHINTILRDPRYAEEKKRYESKFKYGTNLSSAQVYDNIQKLFKSSNKKQHL